MIRTAGLKRASAAALATALLGSFLPVIAAGPTLADDYSYGTVFPYTTTQTWARADGFSQIRLTFAGETATSATVLQIRVSGATFLSGSGTFAGPSFSYPATSLLLTDPTNVTVIDGSQVSLASQLAGTATVTVSYIDASSVIFVADSTAGFTFYGAPTIAPSSGAKRGGTDVTLSACPGSFTSSSTVDICGTTVTQVQASSDGTTLELTTPRCKKAGLYTVTSSGQAFSYTYTKK